MTPLERFELHFPPSLRAANPELHDAFDAVKALVEAARCINIAITCGRHEARINRSNPLSVDALRDALALFGENA